MARDDNPIHDWLAGARGKAIPRDSADDLLFAGSRREVAMVRPSRGAAAARGMFEMPPQVAAPVAPSHAQQPPPSRSHARSKDAHLATVRVSRTWLVTPYAIPFAVGALAVVLIGGYLYARSERPTVAAAVVSDKPVVERAIVEAPAPANTPIVEPIAAVTVTPIVEPIAAVTVTPIVEPIAAVTVTPIEPTEAPAPAARPTAPREAAVADTVTPAPNKMKKSKRQLARERRAAKRAAKRAKQREAAARVARVEKAQAADNKLGGNGALQIASAEPREVWVDGRNSKRMTPLRVLLAPGKHEITLFDKVRGKARTFDVEIKANQTTKVSK